MIKSLTAQVADLPESEGIFKFADAEKRCLFVGAAQNIKQKVENSIKKPFWIKQKIIAVEYKRIETGDLINQLAAKIRDEKPALNITLDAQKLYPHFKITREEYPKLLITRKIENDRADYFGAFLPETGARFLLDFLIRTFRLRSCLLPIDGNFPTPCTQYYEKLCVAPCVSNLCDADSYREFVYFTQLYLKNERTELCNAFGKKIESAVDNLEFEKAALWRDLLLKIQNSWNRKDSLLSLDDAVDSYKIFRKNNEIFLSLVTQRGRKILGKRIFAFNAIENFSLEEYLSQFLWQFYQFHAPKEIRITSDFSDRQYLSEILSRRKNRNIQIKVNKSNNKKITTERAFNRSEFEFEFKNIKLPLSFTEIQTNLRSEFNLRRLPKRIECFDVAHIAATNFVVAKSVWSNGVFEVNKYRFWFDEEKNELEMMETGIANSLNSGEPKPDLILIDGGKPQLSAALQSLARLAPSKISVLAAVKPPQRHQEVSHFINENGKVFPMKIESEAMQLLVRLRDEAHDFANHLHRTQRDFSHFYELAGILPMLTEIERNLLLRKFGSIKNIKKTVENDFIEVLGNHKGSAAFQQLNQAENSRYSPLKALIVPIRYDDPNGEAKDLRPLRDRKNRN